ncbi:MAG: pentapeptide repeat-containing protein [Algicola sp.]|nr:pentapeptide repeat-containing protein [Algicola sp.]
MANPQKVDFLNRLLKKLKIHLYRFLYQVIFLILFSFLVLSMDEMLDKMDLMLDKEDAILESRRELLKFEKERYQQHRYDELLTLLWPSVNENNPLPSKKKREEAVKEFLSAAWIPALKSASLEGANLSNLKIVKMNFVGINLSNADLGNSNFSFTNFKGANLSGASLIGAELFAVNFEGADLTGTLLTVANLAGANLKNVKGLTCQRLKNAINWKLAHRNVELACEAEIPPMQASAIEK